MTEKEMCIELKDKCVGETVYMKKKIRMAVIPVETSTDNQYSYLYIDIPYIDDPTVLPYFYVTSTLGNQKINSFFIEYPDICLYDKDMIGGLLSLKELEVLYVWICGMGVFQQLLQLWKRINSNNLCKIDISNVREPRRIVICGSKSRGMKEPEFNE